MARRAPKFFIPKQSGAVKVVVEERGLIDFLQQNKQFRDGLVHTAQAVANEAQATASDAENGAGGTIDGYAAAGFTVRWDGRGKRPQVIVQSDADTETITAVHFHTQKVWGVAHLRKALYKFTTRG